MNCSPSPLLTSLALVGILSTTLISRPAAASEDPARSTRTVASSTNITQLAYVLAWRNAQEADEHTDALRLTAAFASRIGLDPGTAAYEAIKRFLDNELAANPGRFTDDGNATQEILTQLLREDVGGFQRILSPLLSDECYTRYQELLTDLRVAGQ